MDVSRYNATVTEKNMVTPDIMILKVSPDKKPDSFEAGQYTLLGLFGEESRSFGSDSEVDPAEPQKLIKRPYCFSSGNNITNNLEFYISQVKSGQLSPRLFGLEPGRRIFVGDKISGLFRLDETPDGNDIVMIATGTGVAPYISFLRSHIVERPESKMVVVQGAAHRRDLGYYSELESLETAYANFFYFPTLTDPDSDWKGYRMSVEELMEREVIQNQLNISPDPERTTFFLCGNPKMIEHVSGQLASFGYVGHQHGEQGSLYAEAF
ncbi:ferredoxin--NADP reductase [Chlorobium phaeobacteroides]|uniref:ferredoxin--NADP(+) reductase n=1 Tax=Chlorobium phaeobacteroides (strain DSM 266 / SMG 266 / 2430) TaxID=290317 RepID=A1BGG4_CHLPD|nr:ferredoxin--NADP reductase [Chlorobium phaeobacteroides]ABL65491.1 oxidoreductase FAD/NAD(P)-binding domain protein [Chlorobium phaeobacteroides DSM 266]